MSEERDPELEIVYAEADVSDPVGLAKERAEEIIRDTYPFAFGALFDLPPGARVRMGWRGVDGNVHWGSVIRGDDTHLLLPAWMILDARDAEAAGIDVQTPGPGVTILDGGMILVEHQGDPIRSERRK